MNCENYSLESLMNKASLYYINLKSSSRWKIETNMHQQIIALTTQINEMNDKLSKLTSKAGDTLVLKSPGNSQEMKGEFPLWQLKKVSNSEEHCMIERDGANGIGVKIDICLKTNPAECTACTSHVMGMLLGSHKKKFLSKTMLQRRVTLLLLCLLHNLCLRQLLLLQNLKLVNRKLSLLKLLQSALMTKASISESQFKQIWDEACSSSEK